MEAAASDFIEMSTGWELNIDVAQRCEELMKTIYQHLGGEEKSQILNNLVGKSTVISYRRAGRLSIVVSWAVDEILSFVPKEPKQPIFFTQELITKLRSKGMVLHTPEKVFKDILHRMLSRNLFYIVDDSRYRILYRVGDFYDMK